MKTHILIYSIVRDLPYLEYCLKSIEKFATGFSGVTVVIPHVEWDQFAKMNGAPLSGMNLSIKFYNAPEDRGLWHLKHQAEKCFADVFVPEGTDFIFFMDSDCFFTEPVTPEDYITVEGKPILCIEEYRTMPEKPWQQQTSSVLGIDAKFETMRRHGAIHYKSMFYELREEIERIHGRPFMDFVMSLKADFPWGISEFNAMGNFVLNSHWQTKYQFIDVAKEGYPKDKMLDVWCHAPPDQAQPNRYRGKFPPTMTVKQIWEQLGL